jgi:hypothetical protein
MGYRLDQALVNISVCFSKHGVTWVVPLSLLGIGLALRGGGLAASTWQGGQCRLCELIRSRVHRRCSHLFGYRARVSPTAAGGRSGHQSRRLCNRDIAGA